MEIGRYMAATDQELARMSMDGDPQAFAQLFNRYRDSIYQLYMGRLDGNADDTNDLLQETFIKVFLNLHKYKEEYTFGQWVYTIARNTFIDHIRKKRDDISLDDLPPGMHGLTPAAPAPTPEESFINSQQRTLLESYLERMSERYRTLIRLRFFKGYSYEEIAAELSLRMGTVKTQIHRAREQLCRMIVEENDILP